MNNKLISIIFISITVIASIIILVEFPPEDKDELPTHLGLGPAPGMDLDVGEKVPQFITTGNSENPDWTKYKDTLIIKDYDNLQVFLDDDGSKDIILYMNPMQNYLTAADILYFGEFIWITIDTNYDNDSDYSPGEINEGYRLVSINDKGKLAALQGRIQLIDFDGIKGVILPLDLWFKTDDYSYTIRGHITESEAIQLANIMLVIEQR